MKILVNILLFLISISHVALANISQRDVTFSNPVNVYFYQGKLQGKIFEVQSQDFNTQESQVAFFLDSRFSEENLIDFAHQKLLKTEIDGLGIMLFLDNQNLLNLTEEQRKQIPVSHQHLRLKAKLIAYHDEVAVGERTTTAIPLGYLMDGQQRVDLTIQPIHLQVKAKSCEINPNSLDQKVILRKIATSDIPNQGSETFGGQFSLGLTCDENVIVHAMIKDNTTPTNQSDILTLNPLMSGASGVGIRLYRSTEAIVFLRTFEFSHHQRHPNVLFRANYVNTTGKVTPGSVHATAVISFSYQ